MIRPGAVICRWRPMATAHCRPLMTLQMADLQAVMKPGVALDGWMQCMQHQRQHLPTDSRMRLSINAFLNLVFFASDS